MDFQEWLLKLGLHKKLPSERVKQVEQYSHKLQSQGQKVSIAHIVVQGKLLTKSDIEELHQHYQKLQKLSTLNTQRMDSPNANSQNKITLFEELLDKDNNTPVGKAIEIDENLEGTQVSIPQRPSQQKSKTTEIDENLEATQVSMQFPEEVKVIGESKTIDFDDTFSGDKKNLQNHKHQEGDERKKIGKYNVIRKLGQGNMGEVYLVHDEKLNRQLALKLILASSRDKKSIERFEKEARSIAQLQHANIIKIYDIYPENDQIFFTMDYIQGQTLEEYIYSQKQKKIHFHKAAEIILKVTEALAVAHHKKLIHRDIKPANIMLDKKNKPYLMDFGLVQEISGSKVSETQAFVGTPSYMSPEQAMSKNNEIDEQSDIYSLGVTFYEMLTGHLPFRSKELITLLTQIVRTSPTSPSEYAKIPKILEVICLKAMAKDKKDRYLTADEMVGDLEKYFHSTGKKNKKTVEVVYQKREKTSEEKYTLFGKYIAMFLGGMFLMFMLSDRGNLLSKLDKLEKEQSNIKDLYKLAKEENQNLQQKLNKSQEEKWQTAIMNLPERKIKWENVTPKEMESSKDDKFSFLHVSSNPNSMFFTKKNKEKVVILYWKDSQYHEKGIGNTTIFSSIFFKEQPYFLATNGIYTFIDKFEHIYPKFKLDKKTLGSANHTAILWEEEEQIIFGNASSGTLDAVDLKKNTNGNDELANSLAWSYQREGVQFRSFSSISQSNEFIALGIENYLTLFIKENLKKNEVDKAWVFQAKEKVLVKPIIEIDKIYFIADNELYIGKIGNLSSIKFANEAACSEYKRCYISGYIRFLLKNNNFLYICAGKTLHIIELENKTDNIVNHYRYSLPENIKVEPLFINNLLYVYSEENGTGTMYVFSISAPINKYFLPYRVSEWQIHQSKIYYIANDDRGSYIVQVQPEGVK